MLTVDDLGYRYDALEYRFSLQVKAGECLAIRGPSGAGKSTLLNLLAGFLLPESGTLRWQTPQTDILLNPLSPWERPVSTVFQDHNLIEHLPLWMNVGIGLHPGLKLTTVQREQIRGALSEAGLPEMEHRLPGELSGGQRQRVALVRAWLRHRPLLLLDEPFSGLDLPTRERMWQEVRRQCQQGVAVVLVSHDEEDVRALADRVLWCRDGALHENPAPASAVAAAVMTAPEP